MTYRFHASGENDSAVSTATKNSEDRQLMHFAKSDRAAGYDKNLIKNIISQQQQKHTRRTSPPLSTRLPSGNNVAPPVYTFLQW